MFNSNLLAVSAGNRKASVKICTVYAETLISCDRLNQEWNQIVRNNFHSNYAVPWNINSIMWECNLRRVKLSECGPRCNSKLTIYTVRLPHTISSLLGSDGYGQLLINQVTNLHGCCNATFAINTAFAIACNRTCYMFVLLWVIANSMRLFWW